MFHNFPVVNVLLDKSPEKKAFSDSVATLLIIDNQQNKEFLNL